VLVECGAGGGAPWQEVQVLACAAPPVQVGVFVVPPVSPAPWQAFVQVSAVPFQLAATVPDFVESVPQARSTLPFEWLVLAGTAWHSVQAMAALRSLVFWRWARWAPTARVVVAVSPFVPTGGAAASCGFRVVTARPAVPWQEVQVRPFTSTVPFRWVALFTVVAVKPVWQLPQAVTVEWGAGGGAPWQAVQPATWVAPPDQVGLVIVPPVSPAPWQAFVQVVPVQVGEAPPERASAPQAISTVPFAWVWAVGTVWHSVQASAAVRSVVPVRWARCAPTPRAVTAVLPRVSMGGAAASCGFSAVAARVAVPWQVEQVRVTVLTVPFRWVALATVVEVKPVWQLPQAAFWTCGAAGGDPWQAPQVATCDGPAVQDGEVMVPPARVTPWQ